MNLRKSKTSKLTAGIIGVSMTLSLFAGIGVQTAGAQALSLKDLVELFISLGIISADKATQARAAVAGSGSSGSGTGYQFSTNLTIGSTGEDVRQLQISLNSDSETMVASSGVGSPGNETSYFGNLTRAAVIKFQLKYGIVPPAGFVGPITRSKLNSMGGGVVVVPPAPPGPPGPPGAPGPTPPPVSTGTGITVSAPSQPANNLAPENALRVPFTKVTLTAGSDGDVVVNSLTVERTGLAADAAFSGIVLLDEDGTQLGIAKTFNSNHQAVIGEAITIKAGTSKTLSVSGNMAADNDARGGQTASLAVVAVNTGATVTGNLPITGATHTINSTLSIGSLTNERGPLDPNAAVTKNVGTKAYTFSSAKFTAGSTENVRLLSIRWNQASSAGGSDLENVMVVVDGVEYPTKISNDGKFYTTNFGNGLLIEKGFSKEISIKGDIAGGSGRTVAFNLEKTTDVYIVGELYGFGITPPTSGTGFSAGTIWYAGKTVTIDTGSMTIEKAPSVPAQNIAVNLANQPLGGFQVDTKGEPITVGKIEVTVATTGTKVAGSNATLTNVTMVDQNGSVVAGPSDCDADCNLITFSDTILLPVGKTTYTLKGKAGTGFPNDATVILSFTPSTAWTTVTGQVTGKTITPPSTSVSMNTMTVKAAQLAISVSSNPAAQTIVSGVQGFTFANYQLSGLNSGEDVRVNTLPLAYHAHGGSTATNLTNCNLYDDAAQLTTGTNVVNPSAEGSSTSFSLDKSLIVPKGTVKTLALKCNVAASATGSYSWGFDSAASVSVTGVTSGQSATLTLNDATGPKITLASAGTLTVTLDSSTPSYGVAAAGTTNHPVTVLRIAAANEDIRVTDIALQLPINASSSPTDLAGGKVTMWDGATQVGEAIFTGGKYLASSTMGICSGCQNLIVTKNADKLITIKADFSAQGTSEPGTPGTLIAINYDGDGAQGVSGGIVGVGTSSGTTVTASGSDSASNGVRVYKSYPTLALVDLPSAKLTAGRPDLMRFKVTAASAGDVGIAKITFRIATSSATAQLDMIDNANVYVFSDSSYSTVASGVQTDGALSQTNYDTSTHWVSASTDIQVWAADSSNASTTVVIPAGQSRYFAIRGDATTAGTQFSVSTQLQGDAKFVGGSESGGDGPVQVGSATTTYLASTTVLHNSGDNDFIWRPFSTSTVQGIEAIDYSTGYGVPGLPNSNTNAQIMTQ